MVGPPLFEGMAGGWLQAAVPAAVDWGKTGYHRMGGLEEQVPGEGMVGPPLFEGMACGWPQVAGHILGAEDNIHLAAVPLWCSQPDW